MSHTPGPWKAVETYDEAWGPSVYRPLPIPLEEQPWDEAGLGPYGDHIASVPGGGRDEQALADARLIAAAPDLYEALERIEAHGREWDRSHLHEHECYEDIARAALAKVRGET